MKTFIKGLLTLIALFVVYSIPETGLVLATTPFVDLPGACSKVLRYLEELTKENTPFGLGRRTGMLDMLTNPQNGLVQLDLNNTQNMKKYIKSKVVYRARTKACEWLEDGAIPDVCDGGDEPVQLSVDVTINKRISSPVRTFNNDDMINICQDTQRFIQDTIMNDMRAGREKADEYLLGKADDAIGRGRHQDNSPDTPPGGHKVKRLLGTDSSTGTQVPLYANFVDVKLDYGFNQLNGVPQLIGDGILEKFMELAKYSCCNADGVSYEASIASSGTAFYLDQAASAILGSNNFLSIAPHTLFLLWFNKNHNININSPTRQRLVIPDPIYPSLKWDLDFEFACDDSWNYKLSTYLDLFQGIQNDAFGTDYSPQHACEDELAGMTGVFGWTATSA